VKRQLKWLGILVTVYFLAGKMFTISKQLVYTIVQRIHKCLRW